MQGIQVKQKGKPFDPPANFGMRVVLAEGGLYTERTSEMFDSCVLGRVKLPDLEEHEEFVRLKVPKIPERMVAEALGFFKAAFEQHQGEAALVLLYNKTTKEWRWYCPEQWAGGGMSVEFKNPLVPPDGFCIFGDMHSHPSFSPEPSGVDINDEIHRDGLHLIAGYVVKSKGKWWGGRRQPGPQISATFAIDQARIRLKAESVLEDLPHERLWIKPPAEWMAKITHREHAAWWEMVE